MSDPANVFFRVVKRIRESIALYPVLIPAVYVVIAALVFAFESTSTAASLRGKLPPGLIDPDNSREILGTLITGIISLTVFSFSMVMPASRHAYCPAWSATRATRSSSASTSAASFTTC